MLLARSAENLYWYSRYLERTDDTARVVREHTNLIVDLPTTVPMTWAPLLAIVGSDTTPAGGEDEASVIHHLVADRSNPSSIVCSVASARDNLRSVRELVPSEQWHAVNDLYLYAIGNVAEGVARASRRRFLDRIVADCQRLEGIVGGAMSRTPEYSFLRLGTLLERADMTTRVVDVSAATVGAQGELALHADVQWSSVLRSVAGLQMFRRSGKDTPSGGAVVGFLFASEAFPRAVAFCLRECASLLAELPDGQPLAGRCRSLCVEAQTVNEPSFDAHGEAVRRRADQLQSGIAELHDQISLRYFRRSEWA